MGRSVTFDHTADLGLRIYATDLADLFRTAAEALFDVIVTHRDQVEPLESEQFHLAADSTDALLATLFSIRRSLPERRILLS